MIKSLTPIEVSFQNLNSSIAWAKIREYVKETLEHEQEKFFSMEDNGTGSMTTRDAALREQRLKVKHYRELWETIQLYVLNSTRKGGNHG